MKPFELPPTPSDDARELWGPSFHNQNMEDDDNINMSFNSLSPKIVAGAEVGAAGFDEEKLYRLMYKGEDVNIGKKNILLFRNLYFVYSELPP